MSNPFDVTDADMEEEYLQWEKDHSVRISANESYRADVSVLVCEPDRDNGRIRMDVGTDRSLPVEYRQRATACMTPEQARRLAGLLLAAAAEGASA